MGMTVFAGMLVATVIGVLVVPALFVIIERYVARSESNPTPTSTPTQPEGS
jgi:HAE1 family hydrophobic/amphiphilic exporter-1